MSKLNDWIEKRWPLQTFWKIATEEDIPGGSSYAYVFGSAVLFLFLLQIVTGVWQLFYYVPTTDHAYQSLAFLRLEVPFGWLIHGLHYWGAQAMIILLGVHLARVYIFGGYKKPRELTWILGVFLLLLTMAMSFTGAALPWDETGYWASEVGTSIAGVTPVIGTFAENLLRGGAKMGQLTLSRFFILHVAILPAILLGFIALHLVAFRQNGSVGPWKEERRKRIGKFWPDQVFKDAFVFTIILLILIGLAAFLAPSFSGAADALDTSFHPKPEWNFLFLYQAIKAFQGPWEPVGTIGIPTVGFIVLFTLPFFDKKRERNPLKRPFAMIMGIIVAGGVITLTITGYYSHPGSGKNVSAKTKTSAVMVKSENKLDPPPPAVGGIAPLTVNQKAGAKRGAQLFTKMGCIGCHTVNGVGGKVGPNLSGEGLKGHSANWITTQIRDPKSHDPKTVMPSFASLTADQVSHLVDYVMSLRSKAAPSAASSSTPEAASAPPKPPAGQRVIQLPSEVGPPGKAADIVGSVEHGKILFDANCASCHGMAGKGGVSNPGSYLGHVPALNPVRASLFSKNPADFAENLDRFIENGAYPPGPHPEKHMAAMSMIGYGKTQSLTQPEIGQIITYIMHLNGVNRAKIMHPGIPPKTFFFISLGIFVVIWIILGVLRLIGTQEKTRTSEDRNTQGN